MTKKDYIAIAKALKNLDFDKETKEKIADVLSEVFKRDNPRFDNERFHKAIFS